MGKCQLVNSRKETNNGRITNLRCFQMRIVSTVGDFCRGYWQMHFFIHFSVANEKITPKISEHRYESVIYTAMIATVDLTAFVILDKKNHLKYR